MKKYLVLLVCIGLMRSLFGQQDPQYNMYQFNPLIINPAYAGARDGLSVAANVRNQWVGFTGAPKTNIISAHAPIANKKVGVGFIVLSDRVGPRSMVGFAGNFAYIAKLNSNWKLSLGLSAGYNRFQFDYRDITFKTVDNTSQSIGIINAGSLDFNSGFYLRTGSFFVGISFTHIAARDLYNKTIQTTTETTNLSYRLRTHNFLTIGKSFIINQDVVFAPTLAVRRTEKGRGNLDINLNFFLYKKLWLGAIFRTDYGPGFLINYYVTPKFKVGYSYDMGLGDARKLGASHEVTIGFDFLRNKTKIISPRFL